MARPYRDMHLAKIHRYGRNKVEGYEEHARLVKAMGEIHESELRMVHPRLMILFDALFFLFAIGVGLSICYFLDLINDFVFIFIFITALIMSIIIGVFEVKKSS